MLFLLQDIMLAICVVGTILFLLEVTSFVLNIKTACEREGSDRVTMFEEVVSFLILLLEDLPMVALYSGRIYLKEFRNVS